MELDGIKEMVVVVAGGERVEIWYLGGGFFGAEDEKAANLAGFVGRGVAVLVEAWGWLADWGFQMHSPVHL